MATLDRTTCEAHLVEADHGVLATSDPSGRPHAVPVCFVVQGGSVVIPVDRVKPKSGTDLRRVRNAESAGGAALLVECWDPDDWTRLWWVRADLTTSSLSPTERTNAEAALRARYVQYRSAGFHSLLALTIDRLTGWSARADGVA